MKLHNFSSRGIDRRQINSHLQKIFPIKKKLKTHNFDFRLNNLE